MRKKIDNLQNETEAEKPNFKPKDNYVKTAESKQDLVSANESELKQRFEGFVMIGPEDLRAIQPGTYIRYLKDGILYRAGGVLKLNKWPKYWLLESVDGKRIRWSVPLQNTQNIYYMKDPEIENKKEKSKKIYEAVMKNKMVLVDAVEYEQMRKLCYGDATINSDVSEISQTDGEEEDDRRYYKGRRVRYYDDEDDDDDDSSVKVDLKFQKTKRI